jgi:hypothetical protein
MQNQGKNEICVMKITEEFENGGHVTYSCEIHENVNNRTKLVDLRESKHHDCEASINHENKVK